MQGETESELLERLTAGDTDALGPLFDLHRGHLLRLIELRLDRRVRNRIDPADVVQDAFMEASRSIGNWGGEDVIPFRMWLRVIVRQKTIDQHRRHVEAGIRDVRREQPAPLATSINAAARFIADMTSPSSAAARAEEHKALEEALEGLDPMDREVLVCRHVEQLSVLDVARELGIEAKAASKRYLRALERLRLAIKGPGTP